MPACATDGCDRSARTRGLCSRHYMQWWRYGDATREPRVYGVDPATRLLLRTVAGPDGCLLWTGAPNEGGYSHVSVDRQEVHGHRVIWEAQVGVIPQGLTIDHLCRRPLCLNVTHMELVTNSENVRRAWAFRLRKEGPETT